MRKINEIILHCSATPAGKDYAVEQIRQWHKKRGFVDIGYHFVIYRDGSIHRGRAIEKSGAHCIGHNTHSIGICYIGGMTADNKRPMDTRTTEQKVAIKQLIAELRQQYGKLPVHGHREFANKACPCMDAFAEYN